MAIRYSIAVKLNPGSIVHSSCDDMLDRDAVGSLHRYYLDATSEVNSDVVDTQKSDR